MTNKKQNTGNWNTGYWNTGGRNTGNWNTGDRNTGGRNTGNWNTGNWNTGDRNTGNWNTGNWNTGDRNTGYCNSITPDDCLIFNKPAKRKDWFDAKKPNWMFVSLTEWISESKMSDKEKDAYPSYVSTGGYLKAYATLQDAFKERWDNTTQEDRELTKQLPNFDPVVFEEVFGFKPVFESKKKKVTLELTDVQLEEIKKIIGE